MSFAPYIAVAAGGAVGALGRFTLGGVMLRLAGPGFPWGTLAANIIGAFVMGLLVELFALKLNVLPAVRTGLTVGLLGGFTTFSAFSLEAALMIERNEWGLALAYAVGSVTLCILALFAGLALVRSLG